MVLFDIIVVGLLVDQKFLQTWEFLLPTALVLPISSWMESVTWNLGVYCNKLDCFVKRKKRASFLREFSFFSDWKLLLILSTIFWKWKNCNQICKKLKESLHFQKFTLELNYLNFSFCLYIRFWYFFYSFGASQAVNRNLWYKNPIYWS